jgi:hypothetical protein
MIVALLALFIAVGGVAWAAFKLPRDSVKAKHIKSDAVRADEIADSAVGADEIAGSAVGADEIAVAAVGASEIAPGAVGSDQIARDAVRSTQVADGSLGLADIRIAPGETVIGAFSGGDGGAGTARIGLSLPRPAPAPLHSSNISVAGGDDGLGSGCSGSATNPTAPAGKACIYATDMTGVNSSFGGSAVDDGSGEGASRAGFQAVFTGSFGFIWGTWAYTAPTG